MKKYTIKTKQNERDEFLLNMNYAKNETRCIE